MDPFPDDDTLPLPIELQDQSVPLASLAAGSLIGDVLAWNGLSWVSATPGVPINGVSGPLTGSTTNALSRWSNTDGNRLSNSTITLSDAGIFSTLKSASDVNSSDDFKINNLTVLSAENTNTFAGLTVAYNITSGINNVGLGLESLKMLSTGSRNVSLGSTNLTNLTTGANNVSLGAGTAFDLTTGSNNIILGAGATAGNSNAQNRIVLGNGSGVYNNGFHIPVSTKFYFPLLESTAPLANVLYYDDTTGTIAQGTLTPQSDEFLDSVFRINDFNDPSAQLAFDCSDIASSTTRTIKIPNANMLLPVYSVSSISTGNLSAVLGNQNAYYGIDVGASSGNQNTAMGYQSAKSNLTGSSNLTLGYQSGYSTTGSNTLSIGNRAAYSNTTGQYNTVVGHQANYTNSTGNASSIYGYQAGYTNQSSNVSAFGYQSLYSLTSGDENSAFGYQTLFNNTIGSYNTVFGYNSGKTNISGAGLTAFGARSLETSTGNDNSAFGRNSLLILSTGINNTAFGSHAGISLIEGSNNTLLGYNADTPTDSTSGSIVIGPETVGKTNNTSSNGNNILTIKTPVANQGAYTNTIRNLPGPYILNYNAATEEITYVEGGGGGSTFLDDVFRVLNVDDLTKKFAVDCQYIATSTTRTFTVPDFDGIFPGLDVQNNLILGSIDSNITSGTNNTIIGKNAGASITTGANNVLVGYSVNTTYNNSILIGSSGTANNQIRIGFNGTSSLQTNTYIDGIYNNYTAGYIVVASSAGLLGSSNLLTINNEITANSVFEATVGAQVGYATGTAPPENGLLVAGAVGIGTETPLGILNIADVITDVQTISSFANSQAGLIINNTFEPTISTNLLAGQYIQSTFISPDTLTADSIAGLYVSNIYDANVGIITNAYGILADSGSTGVGTILNAYSGYFKSPLAGSSRVALYADSLLVGYNTTTTSGSTTTLTNASMTQQFFTGTSTQTVVLPVVSTLFLGYQFVINNRSTQSITVQSSGLNTIIVMPANTTLVATCVLTTGTSASSWDVIYNGATSSPVTSITGTANQVLVNGTTGIPQTSDITLTLPQSINTTSSPTFSGLTTTGTTLLNSATAVGGSDPVQVVGNLSLGATASSTTGVLRFTSGGSFNAIQSGLTASGGSAATLYFTDYGQNNIWMRLTSTGRLTIGSATATDMFNVGTAAQFRVTSLGVVSAGSWNGSVIGLQYGGTNNNLSSVITGAMVFCNGSALAYTAAGSSGQILVSQGTSTPIWSTATFPATAGTAGTILRSNGTNIVNSTSTFSDTYTASSILYSNGANTVVGLTTANNGVLITSGAGVPSISSTLPSAVQTNITQVGTITSGVWNATVIGLAYGGTNANITVITGAVAFCNATGLALTAVGTAGQLLQSAATGTPVWTSTLNSTIQTNITQLGTITSGIWNASIISGTYGGTGVNNSTRTITVSAGSAGRILASDASGNAAYSTNTYPTTAGTTGTILRSNGTNIVNSTSTFSDTYTASSILYSNGANTVVGLTTANNGVLITSGTGVPSISSTLPTTVQTNITQVGTITTGVWNATVLSLVYGGTNVDNSAAATGGIAYKAATTIAITAAGSAGQLLRSNGASAPTFTTATYPSTAGTTSTVLRSDGTNWVNSSGMTVDSAGAINTTSTISAGGSLFSGSNLSSTATGAYNAYFAGTQTTTSGGLQYTIAAASTLNPTAGGSNVYAHAVIPNITSVIATVITNTGGIYINPVVSSNAGTINRFSGIFVDATAATGAGAINSSYGGYFTTPLAGTSRVALYADTFFAGYDTTATAGTTTTLTNVSKTNQYFTGTLAQTVVLPVVSTLYLGSQYYINNRSTQSITVQSSGTNSIAVIPSNTSAVFTCIATSGTTAASWDFAFDGSQTSGTVTSVLGTSNQITTTGTTVITVALSSTLVTPGTLSINAMTAGSVFFSGASGLVSQKNANFFWDNANNRLGINTNAPGVDLDVIGNGRFSGTLTTASAIVTGTITSASAVITGTITSANATITSTLTTASAVITGTITAANATVSGTITTVNAVATGTLAVGSGAPFTVTATGVVGISTASTTARLNINATTNCIRAGDDFTADATNPLLSLFGNTVVPIIKIVKSGVMSGYITTSSSGFVFNTDTVNVIDFRTGASTASTAPNTQGTSRLYINTTGVGLQATPTQALEIGGTNAQMYLNSATSNMIQFNTNGVAGPTFTTTRSLGTKLILYPQFANGTSADYAIGINSNTLWYGVPTTTQIHSWFGGITEWMRLNNTGLTIGSTTTTGMLNIGTAAQFQVSSAGAVATSSSLTCGGSLFANSIFTANSANRYNAVFTGTQTPTDGSSNQWTVASIATFAPAAGSTNSFAYYAGPAIAVPISLTAANAGGLYINLDYTGNAGTITNSYGVYVRAGNATAGTITNAYGGYFTSPSAGISRTALYADSLLLGYATTATAAGTTTLTNTSLAQQFFTGSTTQTVVLPVVSTLFLGHQFFINNRSSGIVTIQSSGLNTITAMPANTSVVVICILTTGTSAASWDFIYNGASTSPVTSIAGTSNQINASASTGAVTLSLSSTIVTPGTLAVNGALTFGTTFTVTGAGSATSMSNLANFTSGGTPTAGNLYSIYIDRTGVEAVALGINKNTTTDSIPANSVFISTYNSAGTISIGRGGNNTLPSTADIFIGSTGNVSVGSITTTDMFNVGSAAQFRITSTGVVSAGLWNGSVISLQYGGTNANISVITGAVAFCNSTGLALTAVGSSGQLLQSANTGTPTWTSTLNSTIQTNITQLGVITSGTWNASIISGTYGGTGINNSTRTITISAGSQGRLLSSDASGNAAYSTITYPITSIPVNRMLRSDGTNILSSSVSYTDSYTANQILYASSANTVAGLSTVNNGILACGGTGIPVITTTIPSATQLNITNTGTITTGTWQGTVVGVAYGGTGTTLQLSGGAGRVLKQLSAGATIVVQQLAASELSNGTTGTGLVVLQTSPTLTTPVLGTPSSGTLTNCTGYPSSSLSGLVPLSLGGTNANLSAVITGSVVFCNGSVLAYTAVGTSGQILRSAGTGTPAWSTATFPSTAGSVNTILRSDGTNWINSSGMTVDSAGYINSAGLGIGNNSSTTPSVTLSGDLAAGLLYSMFLLNTNTASGSGSVIKVCNSNNTGSFTFNGLSWYRGESGYNNLCTLSSYNSNFYVGGTDAANTNCCGILDTNPRSNLSIVGNAQIGFASGTTSTTNGLIVSGNTSIGSSSATSLFNVGSSNQFQISSTGTVSTSSTIASSALTTGSVLFSGASGIISQKNSNFFWDNTNNRLGIGLSTPTVELDMAGSFKMVGTTANIVTFASSVNQGITYSGLSNSVGVAPCTVGFRFTVGSNSIRVTQLGALQSTGNGVFPSGTRQVAIYDIAGNQLATATADATTPPDNSICYATLATPIILSANTDYIILGFVSANSVGTTFTPVMGSNISFVSYISVTSGSLTFATTNTYLAAFVPYGAVGFKYGLQETTALVTNQSLALNGVLSTSNAVIAGTITTTTATVLGTITTNAAYIASTVIPTSFAALSITYASTLGSSGAVMGRRFTVGSSNLLVTDLGHYQGGFASIFATGTREVAIYDIAGNQLATATVNSATTPENNFRYTAITPIVLLAFTDYIILALEPNGVQVGQGATITYSGITFVSNVSAASNFMIFASGNALGITPTTTGGFKYNSYLTTLSVSNQAVNLNGVMTTTGTLTNSTVVYANNVSSTFTPALGGSLIFAQGLTPTFTTTVTTAITTAGSIYINNTASANAGTITNLAGVFVNAGSAGAGTITNAYGGYFATPAAGISDVALYADSFLLGYATTATAGATTTLTNQSRTNQYFTGSLSQTVVLPVVSTLFLGSQYYINNRSTAGVITVQSSGLNVIATVPSNTSALFTCILTTGTTAASWDFAFDGSQSSTSVASVSGTANQITTTGTTVITVSLPSTLVAPGTVTATGNLTASTGIVKTSETISSASALSTTLDSLLDTTSSSFACTLNVGIANQIKLVRLLYRTTPNPVTVSCVAAGGGSFQLTPSEPAKWLRWNGTKSCWFIEDAISSNSGGSESFYPTTQQGLKLTASDLTLSVVSAFFGGNVAMSADGNTFASAAYGDNINVGAVWVFTRSGTTWTQQGSKLIGTGTTAGSGIKLGQGLALSADGNTLAIGGNSDASGQGATWIFTRTAGTWTQQGTKLVGTGNIGAANQGYSCALSSDGNTLAVGGQNDNTNVGAVWIFTRTGTVWTQQQKIVATGGVGTWGNFLGHSVSLSADGNILASGGHFDGNFSGACWIFTRTGTTWSQQTKLVGTGTLSTRSTQGDSVSLSADGSVVAIGGSTDNANQGATWIFTRSGTIWTQQQKVIGTGNTGSALQGYSVSLTSDGNTLAVGGYGNNSNQGAYWCFTRSNNVWSQVGINSGTGFTSTSGQGSGVALSSIGNTLVVGGYYDNGGRGACWVFT